MCPKNDECSTDETEHKNSISPTLLKPPERSSSTPNTPHLSQTSPLHNSRYHSPKTGSPSTGSPTNIQTRGSFRRRNKSAGAIVKSTYEQYEEKPLPALRQ